MPTAVKPEMRETSSLAHGRVIQSLKAEMRVLLLTDSNVFAGTERHILELARGLQDRNIFVAIGCPADSPLVLMAAASGIEHVTIEKRGLLDVSAIVYLAKLLRRGDFDIVHAHNGRTALFAALACKLSSKGTVVATQHFLEPAHTTLRGLRAIISRAAHRWVQENTHHFIAVSRVAEELMLKRNSKLAPKMTRIPNGISILNKAALSPVNEVRGSLHVPASALLIVCVARLEQEKNIADLVAAMKQVAAEEPNAVCLIAGQGSERSALEEQSKQLGLSKNVSLIGFHEDALSLINACDLFVLPSRGEPFGLVLLEAMALEKAVIATAAGGPLEIVEDNETGFLTTPGDSAALANAIVRLLHNPAARIRMGIQGRERFEKYFNAQSMSAATLAVYRKVLK